MTIQDIQLIIDATTKEMQVVYNITKTTIADGSFILVKGTYIRQTWFLTTHNIESTNLDDSSYDNVISTYNDLIDSTEEHKHKPKFNIELTSWTDYDSEQAEIYWTASWVDIIPESSIENEIKKEIRSKIGKAINPQKDNYPATVDCKNLQMFMEGELTYKGLVNSTYGTC